VSASTSVDVRADDYNTSMCGIAGFSLSSGASVPRTLAAQALLAGIAERGGDAVGYAYRAGDGPIRVTKLRGGATGLLETIAVPASADTTLLHVRDFTKGRPDIEANNHPIRHGSVVGVHNGVIENDEAVLARHRLVRAEPGMTVDSEAIFALMDRVEHEPRALSELRGSLAAAWLDERTPGTLFVARGSSRPLWIGKCRFGTFFASTRRALTMVEATLEIRLHAKPMREGRLVEVADGTVLRRRRFRPNPARELDGPYSPVHSPHEAVSCLDRFATIASAAA
jgi:glutamine---fructose-6-phosphate transaminase (isomerizing)